ncbi:heme ABC transporter substrate-binding protein IsdE [uncultured Ruminococcus sp.]|uniref:heme ABC transporter substrate-binding protein IsdE n=1 Tax=uncultured Ruminococcus sp. TaxID=165186 RepID=UPI00266E9E99|nr:heme ABC transporter substrate-binding protein IsdE [uncultured Ruminococcus sp.]
MKKLRIAAVLTAALMTAALCGCVDQHPEENSKAESGSVTNADDLRIAATSPAVANICDKLDIDLVGVCSSTVSTIPDRYKDATQLGTAMNPDTEILASLDLDWILSPSSLESDLQPKYAAIKTKSAFLNLKSVEGMYKSIEELGEMFDRQEQAQKLVDEYTSFMNKYKNKNKGKESPKVLVLMGLPGSYIVATDNSYVGSLVKLAGGTNVYGDGGGQEFLNANTEDMETKDPDIIVRCAHALPDEVVEMFNEEFSANDIWKHFRAVQEGKVYDLSYEYFGMSAGFDYPQALDELQPILYGDQS